MGTVAAVKDTACKVANALRDLISHSQDLQDDVPGVNISATLLEEINALVSSSDLVATSLEKTTNNLQSTGYPVLLHGKWPLY